MNKKILLKAIEWGLIVFISFNMIVYGGAKFAQFGPGADYNINVSEMTGHELMWAFYGYTLAYPVILGIFEILGAICLLFYRTKLFGALLLSIMLFNIILQDYFYKIIALNTAIVFQILIFIILWFDRERIKELVGSLFRTNNSAIAFSRKEYIILAFSIIIVLGLLILMKMLFHI
ncbi:hypothetical protein [Elizabethkingia meningoseptica]|uniref:hypothetical protein n=1 Tax=Elizabethkingia meningoseptica TaxID=238 RepID=UPI003891938D